MTLSRSPELAAHQAHLCPWSTAGPAGDVAFCLEAGALVAAGVVDVTVELGDRLAAPGHQMVAGHQGGLSVAPLSRQVQLQAGGGAEQLPVAGGAAWMAGGSCSSFSIPSTPSSTCPCPRAGRWTVKGGQRPLRSNTYTTILSSRRQGINVGIKNAIWMKVSWKLYVSNLQPSIMSSYYLFCGSAIVPGRAGPRHWVRNNNRGFM